MGAPVTFLRHGRPMKATHLLSTIPGNKGRVELLRFGKSIGLRQEWLQRIGTEFEHFDVMGGKRIQKAKDAGARSVERRQLMEIATAKREAKTGYKRRRAYAYARAVKRNAAPRAVAR